MQDQCSTSQPEEERRWVEARLDGSYVSGYFPSIDTIPLHAVIRSATPPRLTIVLMDGGDESFTRDVLPSLGLDSQRGLEATAYELVVVANPARAPRVVPTLEALQVSARVISPEAMRDWISAGASEARGDAIFFVGDPGTATPTLVASLCGAFDAYGSVPVIVRTLPVSSADLSRHGRMGQSRPDDRLGLLRKANPQRRWLDVIPRPANIAVPRALFPSVPPGTPSDLLGPTPPSRVQLIGDAFLRPASEQEAVGLGLGAEGDAIDPDVKFFGVDVQSHRDVFLRPTTFVRRERPRLSVIVIVHEMRREAPRTLRTLLPEYQVGMRTDEYEIVVVENGSRSPLVEAEIRALAPNISYHYLTDPPPSPAYAINYGVKHSSGDAIAVMIDGACMLTPGTLSGGLRAFRAFPCPIVVTRYFVLGPGLQRKTILEGYSADVEDQLLAGIDWPSEGYRLFEIASPLTFGGPKEHWLTAWFESNCLFLPRDVFEEIGGCDERFDFPGGGALNLDVFQRACDVPRAQPVQLVGEGVFHQIHGGITSNAEQEDVDAKTSLYKEQYRALRGRDVGGPSKNPYFLGRLAHPASRWKMGG